MRALTVYLAITITGLVVFTNAATDAAEKLQQLQQDRIEVIESYRR